VIILSAHEVGFISSFSIIDSFISFSCPVGVAKTSNTILNRSGDSGHPCLVPTIGKKKFFTIEDDVSCVFVIYGL